MCLKTVSGNTCHFYPVEITTKHLQTLLTVLFQQYKKEISDKAK